MLPGGSPFVESPASRATGPEASLIPTRGLISIRGSCHSASCARRPAVRLFHRHGTMPLWIRTLDPPANRCGDGTHAQDMLGRGRIETASVAYQRSIYPACPAAAREHHNICYSITNWCLASVRGQDPARLPTPSATLAGVGGTRWLLWLTYPPTCRPAAKQMRQRLGTR